MEKEANIDQNGAKPHGKEHAEVKLVKDVQKIKDGVRSVEARLCMGDGTPMRKPPAQLDFHMGTLCLCLASASARAVARPCRASASKSWNSPINKSFSYFG